MIVVVKASLIDGRSPFAEEVSHTATVSAAETDPSPANNVSQLTHGPDHDSNMVIDGCDSGVPNQVMEGGTTFMDIIGECATTAKNHNKFVSCVSKATRKWRSDGLIITLERNALVLCAKAADIP